MRKVFIALAALSLSACETAFAPTQITSNSAFDEAQSEAAQGLIVAWRAFDAILTAVDALQAAGSIQAGSPRALRIADALDTTRNALNAATDAVRVGNSGDFTQAMARAHSALTAARAALGER